MDLQTNLKTALIDFYDNGNKSGIKQIIKNYPEIVTPVHGDFPDLHRIFDISIGFRSYRVCRKISEGEKLTLSLIKNDASSDVEGAPIWLTGEKLRVWAESEVESPSKEAIYWEVWR